VLIGRREMLNAANGFLENGPKVIDADFSGRRRMHARIYSIRISRLVRRAVTGALLALGGCVPNNYFADLAGSSLSAVASVLLSDAVNFLIPPP
jgi:hypothetical protein